MHDDVRQLRGSDVRPALVPAIGGPGDTAANCRCKGAIYTGINLTGDPTICCRGHDQLRGNFGAEIGLRDLWHQGGDVWSTFSDDETEDNPYEHECDDGTDEYDLVLDLSEDPPRIRLEAREALNCNALCVNWYLSSRTFICEATNNFELGKFSGWRADAGESFRLARCVCLDPVVDQSGCESICAAGHPRAWLVTLAGFETVAGSPPDGCECENFNGEHLVTYMTNDDYSDYYGLNPFNPRLSNFNLVNCIHPGNVCAFQSSNMPRLFLNRTGVDPNFAYHIYLNAWDVWFVKTQTEPFDCSTSHDLEWLTGLGVCADVVAQTATASIRPVNSRPEDSGHCSPCGE